MLETDYSPVHCRSVYSFGMGLMRIPEICNVALSMGAPAVGLADVNGFFGLPRFLGECRQRGLKPICGTSLHFRNEHPATLYVLSPEGFSRACRIITRMSLEEADPVALLTEEGFDGLAVLAFTHTAALRLKEASSLVGEKGVEGLYLALPWGRPFAADCRFAAEHQLRCMAVNDALYLEGEDAFSFRVLRAIGTRRLLDDLPEEEGPAPFQALVAGFRVQRFFASRPEALAAASRLVGQSWDFPFPLPPLFPPFGGLDASSAFQRLSTLCRQGILRRYGHMGAELHRRMNRELLLIREKGFSSCFLVVHDVVTRFPHTCGRGSAAASIVSYALGITHVDPVAYDLYFERFLNHGRKDPPDIDIDFPWDEREAVLDYLFETYQGSSALVADHVTFGPRASIRETVRVLAMEKDEADRLCSFWREEERMKLPEPIRTAADRLLGIPRFLGTHPGGVVITPGPLTDHVHYRRSPLGRPVIAWEKDGTEQMGLVKIDFLGNRSLSVLRDAMGMVNPLLRAEGKEPLEWESFSPLEDLEVEQMISGGDTLGVFYVESPATRQLLQKMGRGDYLHLVAASSIIRPAANREAEEYIRRLHGASWNPFSGETGRVLQENLGILIYQEDVCRVAVSAAGFTAAEADKLRKLLSKKDRHLRLGAFRDRFFEGGKRRAVPESELTALWEGILSFDGYSFCKAHSASYALVSFCLAWIKKNYPFHFFVAVLNNGGGFYTPQVYLNALRRLGAKILLPDINRSGTGYCLENGSVRIGLDRIRGVSSEVIRSILDRRRKHGSFSNFESFLDTVKPDAASLRGLIRSGALDTLAEQASRPALFWIAACRRTVSVQGEELFPRLLPEPGRGDYPDMVKLRDELHFLGLFAAVHPLVPYLDRARSLYLRYYGKGNGKSSPRLVRSGELPACEGRPVAVAGYLVAEKALLSAKRSKMAFVSFEDPDGLFEGVLFPDAYKRCSFLMDQGLAFLVSGTVEKRWSSVQLLVQDLFPLFRRSHG